MIRVLQLNISQSVNSFNSLLEKFNVLNSPTQPNPNPSCDRSVKPDNLSENTRVEQAHDGSGQPDECNSSRAHTVKEQHAPDENRDIALFNTDNEFNRAINEENIDFQHSRITTFNSETITWRQRSKFDSEDREPPSSTCTSK